MADDMATLGQSCRRGKVWSPTIDLGESVYGTVRADTVTAHETKWISLVPHLMNLIISRLGDPGLCLQERI